MTEQEKKDIIAFLEANPTDPNAVSEAMRKFNVSFMTIGIIMLEVMRSSGEIK